MGVNDERGRNPIIIAFLISCLFFMPFLILGELDGRREENRLKHSIPCELTLRDGLALYAEDEDRCIIQNETITKSDNTEWFVIDYCSIEEGISTIFIGYSHDNYVTWKEAKIEGCKEIHYEKK